MSGRVYNIDDGQTMVVDHGTRSGSKRVLIYGDGSSSDAASFTSSSTVPMSNMDPRFQFVGQNPQFYQTQATPQSSHHHHHREHRYRSQGPVKDFFEYWKRPVRAPVSVKIAGSNDQFNAVGSGKIVFHD